MKNRKSRLCLVITVVLFLSGCDTGSQFVMLVESTVPGSMAVAKVNIMINYANVSVCKAARVSLMLTSNTAKTGEQYD